MGRTRVRAHCRQVTGGRVEDTSAGSNETSRAIRLAKGLFGAMSRLISDVATSTTKQSNPGLYAFRSMAYTSHSLVTGRWVALVSAPPTRSHRTPTLPSLCRTLFPSSHDTVHSTLVREIPRIAREVGHYHIPRDLSERPRVCAGYSRVACFGEK